MVRAVPACGRNSLLQNLRARLGRATLPVSSGAAPRHLGGAAIQQQFGLTGFEHEGAYRNLTARTVSLYGIVKIAAKAKVPA